VSEANDLSALLGADYGPKPLNHQDDQAMTDSAVGHKNPQAQNAANNGHNRFLRTKHKVVIEQSNANQKSTTRSRALRLSASMDKYPIKHSPEMKTVKAGSHLLNLSIAFLCVRNTKQGA
jgi:hypothetical protein